jgi:hypothetical protein
VPKVAFVMPVIPPELEVDPVLAGLLHCMAFLELSGDDAVDPDWAVEAMEHVAHYLQRLGQAERERIVRQVTSAAGYARTQGSSDQLVEFLETFPEHCGLRGESPA